MHLSHQEAIQLYEKLLTSLGEGEMRHTAVRERIQLYENTGENEKAKQIAANAPDISSCRELLMLNCCDGKSRADEYENVIVNQPNGSDCQKRSFPFS